IGVGTYSSIYIASNTLLVMGVSKEDLLPPVKEDDENRNSDGSQV
ncbi:MAG TPA: protein translocase subunit SecF, partial [Methylophaga aminisulfidivorans]|nr:protein translocase subunit SecF [Methylophaga aminisulfidivorans]